MKKKGVRTGEVVLLSGSEHSLHSSVSMCVTVSFLPFSSAAYYAVAVKAYSCTPAPDTTLSLPVVLGLLLLRLVYTYCSALHCSFYDHDRIIYVKYMYLFTTSAFDGGKFPNSM